MKVSLLSSILLFAFFSGFSQVIPALKINAKNFGATGNGTDETLPLQNALDYLARKGGGTLYVPKGIYIITPQPSKPYGLLVPSNVRILGDGVDKTIFRRSDNDVKFSRLFVTKNSKNIVFENYTVDGNKAHQNRSYEQQHNFFIMNSSGIKLLHIKSENTIGDGIYFYTGSQNSTVINCIFKNIFRIGVNCTNLNGGRILGCTFVNVVNGIKIEKDGPDPASPSRNIIISGCHFESDSSKWEYMGITINGLATDPATNFKIVHNTFKKLYYGVTGLWNVDSIVVMDNTAENVKCLCRMLNHSVCIGLCSGSILVEKNEVLDGIGGKSQEDVVYTLTHFKHVTIKNNVFRENPSYPYPRIALFSQDQNVIFSNNYTIASGTGGGMIFNKCSNVIIDSNYQKMNAANDAIVFTNDSEIKLKSVKIENNTLDGLYRYAVDYDNSRGSKTRRASILNFKNNKLMGHYRGIISNGHNTISHPEK